MGELGELALGPFHYEDYVVDVAVDAGEELAQFVGEPVEGVGEGVEFRDDDGCGCHVCGAHGFAEIPDCCAGFLELFDVRDAVFGVVDHWLEGACEPRYFDDVGERSFRRSAG